MKGFMLCLAAMPITTGLLINCTPMAIFGLCLILLAREVC